MTYALADALQKAVYGALAQDATLSGLVGTAIYDAPPPDDGLAQPGPHVVLGEERVRAQSSVSAQGAVHDFTVQVHSAADGFASAKQIAAAVCDALIDAALALDRGTLVGLQFLQARAARGRPPEQRRILLRFRARLQDV
ncbi:MAG: DUF3168 domain-containing protein [Paracoccaceae bacterium]